MGGFGFPASPDAIFTDVPTYFHQDDVIRIILPDKIIWISRSQIRNFCPRLIEYIDNGDINVLSLASKFARKLHRVSRIDRDFALIGLKFLFTTLWNTQGQVKLFLSQIRQKLERTVDQDFNSGQAMGMLRCRRWFGIFAFFAKTMISLDLASELAKFFMDYHPTIMGTESHNYLIAWGLYFMDLKPLLEPYQARCCFRALAERLDDIRDYVHHGRCRDNRWRELIRIMEEIIAEEAGLGFVDVDYSMPIRGRRPVRPVMYDVPRAITMPPPVVHRQHYLLAPAAPRSSYSRSPSTELVPRGSYFGDPLAQQVAAEMTMGQDHLYHNQRQLLHNQDNLKHDQRLLWQNQFRLEDGQNQLWQDHLMLENGQNHLWQKHLSLEAGQDNLHERVMNLEQQVWM
jgi:hypothetical protein